MVGPTIRWQWRGLVCHYRSGLVIFKTIWFLGQIRFWKHPSPPPTPSKNFCISAIFVTRIFLNFPTSPILTVECVRILTFHGTVQPTTQSLSSAPNTRWHHSDPVAQIQIEIQEICLHRSWWQWKYNFGLLTFVFQTKYCGVRNCHNRNSSALIWWFEKTPQLQSTRIILFTTSSQGSD